MGQVRRGCLRLRRMRRRRALLNRVRLNLSRGGPNPEARFGLDRVRLDLGGARPCQSRGMLNLSRVWPCLKQMRFKRKRVRLRLNQVCLGRGHVQLNLNRVQLSLSRARSRQSRVWPGLVGMMWACRRRM